MYSFKATLKPAQIDDVRYVETRGTENPEPLRVEPVKGGIWGKITHDSLVIFADIYLTEIWLDNKLLYENL